MTNFSVKVTKKDKKQKLPTIHVNGEIDIYTCPELRTALDNIILEGNNSFILDLDNTQYIDSTGLGTIAYSAKNIQNNEGKIYVICTKPQIKKIFQVSGLEKKNIRLFENSSLIENEIENKESQ